MTADQRILARVLPSDGGDDVRKTAFAQLLSASGVSAQGREGRPTSIAEWEKLVEIAEDQGLLILLHDRLAAWLPDPERHRRRASSWEIQRIQEAQRSLALAAETLRLVSALEKEGIRVIPFKGCVLSCLAFDDPAVRQPGDIDLLVQPADVQRAAAVLNRFSYTSARERGPAWRAGHLGNDCEWELVNREKRMGVDLHWNFTARNFGLAFPVQEIWQRAVRIRFCGQSIESPLLEDLILILCLHAVKHYCRRLEWLYTIAALLRRSPTLSWPTVFLNARRYGALRHVRICLLLASALYRAPLPSEVQQDITGDDMAEKLAVRSLHWIMTGQSRTLTEAQQRTYVSETRIGLNAKLSYWAAAIFTPTGSDYRLELPRWLWWSYPGLRLVRLAIETLGPNRDPARRLIVSQD